MKTKNFARFGLFLKGNLIESGDMAELMDAAQRYSQNEPENRFSISSMVFSDGDDVEITEGTKIMSYFTLSNEMYIVKELV